MSPSAGRTCSDEGHQSKRRSAALAFGVQSVSGDCLPSEPAAMGMINKFDRLLPFGREPGSAVAAARTISHCKTPEIERLS